MRKCILFDLDGTLTDSAEGILKCVASALREMERTVPPPETLRRFIGPPLAHSFIALCGMQPEEAQQATYLYRLRYEKSGMFENNVYPGIPAMLERLRAKGYRLLVATYKPEPLAKEILAHFRLNGYFEGIFGPPTETQGGTTKADVIRRALETAGDTPQNAIMVGDRHQDAEAAVECGIPCVGVLYGYGSRSELLDAGATALVESVPELEALLLDNTL